MTSAIEEILSLAGNDKKQCNLIKEFFARSLVELPLRRNSKRQTLLHFAAGYGKKKIVRDLILDGADVNAVDDGGWTPLHNSCSHSHLKTSKLLLEAGADVNITDKRGWNALRFVISRECGQRNISEESRDLIELLLDNGANPYIKSYRSNAHFIDLVRNCDDKREFKLRYIDYLLRNPNHDRSVINEIINQFMTIEDFFELIRVGDDRLETIKNITTQELINSRLPDFNNITPLHRAAGYNQLETAKFLIQEGAQVNSTDCVGSIPLHNAAQYGHQEMIELLVNEGSEINRPDLDGQTPLHIAASNMTFLACLTLVQLGANKNIRSLDGKLPIDLAGADDVRRVLEPARIEYVPSSSDQGVYMVPAKCTKVPMFREEINELDRKIMLDINSFEMRCSKPFTKKVILYKNDDRYRGVERKMLETIRVHPGDASSRYRTYDILKIELIQNKQVWSNYRRKCRILESELGFSNEKLLFHGSKNLDEILTKGFDMRYAQRDGMFGAGIYFAQDSSKSNQYTSSWEQRCEEHGSNHCRLCIREMVLAQVALGDSLIAKDAMNHLAHAPPGHDSITALPSSIDSLTYPEYVIYESDQAYPVYLITYRIKD